MDILILAAGSVLAIVLDYIPGLSSHYDKLGNVEKRLVMGILLAVVSVGYYVAGCYGMADLVECSKDGAVTIFGYFVQAIMANQTVHGLFKPVKKKPTTDNL